MITALAMSPQTRRSARGGYGLVDGM